MLEKFNNEKSFLCFWILNLAYSVKIKHFRDRFIPDGFDGYSSFDLGYFNSGDEIVGRTDVESRVPRQGSLEAEGSVSLFCQAREGLSSLPRPFQSVEQ
jgi:hypothetical protein